MGEIRNRQLKTWKQPLTKLKSILDHRDAMLELFMNPVPIGQAKAAGKEFLRAMFDEKVGAALRAATGRFTCAPEIAAGDSGSHFSSSIFRGIPGRTRRPRLPIGKNTTILLPPRAEGTGNEAIPDGGNWGWD